MKSADFVAAGCDGKKVYSFAHARRAAKSLSYNTDDSAHAYHCRFCHGWHVGTSIKQKRRRADAKKYRSDTKMGGQ